MAEDQGEKSQDPTQHRREEARKHGQVVHSQDVVSAALLLGGVVLLMTLGGSIAEFFGAFTIQQLGGDAWLSADTNFVVTQWTGLAGGLARVLLPLFGFLLLLAVAVNMAQVGFLFVPEKLAFDLSRLDPIAGLGRIFSLSNVVRLAFGIIKIVIVGSVAWWAVAGRWQEILELTALELPQLAAFLVEIVLWTSLKISAALLTLGMFDYAFQRWKHEQDLKMTPQEVREEMRNLQGDPQVLSRRRSVQRQLAANRLSGAVPKADVVITNPTELAIAIQYDAATMAAPIVVAKGAGIIAARIRKLALENGVPIIERKPLAQALYREVELNHPIPDKLYGAVAELLAYVYQLKGKSLPGR